MLIRRTHSYRILNTAYCIPNAPRAFSLLELLVALGIVSLVVVTVLGLMGRGLDVLRREEHRRVALGIAEERLELLRNVPYDDLGTIGGIPSGPFPQEDLIERNGARYTIATRIRAIDDALDNTAPNDAVPTDYRELAVDVSWGLNPNQAVTLATLAAPPGTEQATTTGMLRLRITDARGEPVDGASVQLANSAVSPPIALTLPTDTDGIVALPGAPPSNGGYHVRVTRAGYSVDETIAPSAQNPNPNNPPLTVLAHEVTNANFAIDRLATIALTFQKYKDDKPFHDLTTFTLQGMKMIGSAPNPNPPPDTLAVYKAAPQSFTTNQGAITISNLEWDTYRFSEAMPDFDLAVADPLLPIELFPGTTQEVTIAFEPHRDHSLRVIVRTAAGNPISGASVQLVDVDPPQRTETGTTPAHGQIFFSPLRAGTATLTISHPNFATATRELTIGGTMEVEVRMEPL